MPGRGTGRDWENAQRFAFRIVYGELMASALSQDEIEAGLGREGFCRSHTYHRYFILYVNGKKEAATFLSHGKNQDVGAPLLNAMGKELGLTKREFIGLAECPMSTEELLPVKKEKLASGQRIFRRGESNISQRGSNRQACSLRYIRAEPYRGPHPPFISGRS